MNGDDKFWIGTVDHFVPIFLSEIVGLLSELSDSKEDDVSLYSPKHTRDVIGTWMNENRAPLMSNQK